MSNIKDKLRDPEFYAKLPIVTNPPQSKKEEEYLREIKTYEFFNTEEPGIMHTFTYQTHKITLIPGNKYKFPRFLARHIQSRTTPEYKYHPDGMGNMIPQEVGKKSRFEMREIFEEPNINSNKKKAA